MTGNLLWDELLFFSVIPAKGNGDASFSETIYDCEDDSPYKFEIEVTE